jgi:hypothetical protein
LDNRAPWRVRGCPVSAPLIGPTAAHARPFGDASPPTFLKSPTASDRQRGRVIESEWIYGPNRDGICVSNHGVGPTRFPAPLTIQGGSDFSHIVIRRRKRPRTVSLDFWRQVDESGSPVGDPEPIQARVVKRHREGRIGRVWSVNFRVATPPDGDTYVRLFTRWQDRRCEAPEYAFYTFHLHGA